MAKVQANMLEFFLLFYVVLFCIPRSGSNETTFFFNNSLTNRGNHIIKRECASFLNEFANATQHFNWCMVKHAKPLQICEKCLAQYSWLLNKNPLNFNSSQCVSDLVTSERFQVVMKVYDFQTGLWASAHCDSKCPFILSQKA